MEYFQVSKTDSGLHIEGFPDAVKVVRIDHPRAKRLADFALHKSDLEFAAECLDTINQVSDKPWVLRQALWRSAIVHFMKCFGDSGARSQLSVEKIYKKAPPALTAFAYFKDLRNKHVIHDENSYAQSIPGAALNNGTKSFKIEKILCLSVVGETLEQDNYNNLHLLVQTAKAWVVAEFDVLCAAITKDLEVVSHERLLARESISFRVPTLDDIGKRRSEP